jgi:hypothetical protein
MNNNTKKIIGITLSSIELAIIFLTCCALGQIMIKGKKKSWWVFQKFVEMNGNKLVLWHFLFFLIQFIIIIGVVIIISEDLS